MNKIFKNRGLGKTTDLIRISSEKQYPIVTAGDITYIKAKAKEMGLSIPKPLRVGKDELRGINTPVLVDEAEYVLSYLLGNEIDTITLSIDY